MKKVIAFIIINIKLYFNI